MSPAVIARIGPDVGSPTLIQCLADDIARRYTGQP